MCAKTKKIRETAKALREENHGLSSKYQGVLTFIKKSNLQFMLAQANHFDHKVDFKSILIDLIDYHKKKKYRKKFVMQQGKLSEEHLDFFHMVEEHGTLLHADLLNRNFSLRHRL